MSPHTELDNKVQEKDTSVNSYFKRVEDIEAEIEAPDEGDSSKSGVLTVTTSTPS